jgi:predicted nucleic acid-binding protein
VDSSFVVSLYAPDAHSAAATSVVTAQHEPILLSAIVVLEAANAFELRVFRGQGSESNATRARTDFQRDVDSGILRILPVPPAAWDVAIRISRTHSARLGSRSLDILQVAIAIVLRADAFLTFDRNQAAIAQAEGLRINP